MKLVEIVRHEKVKQECFQQAWDLAADLGRTPVEVKDTTGFLVNRVVRSYYLVAQRLAAEGAGTFAEIDAAVKKVGEVPMGPFELMDFIGLEVNLKISHTVYEGLGKPERLKPHAIQEAVVASGAYGRKTNKGFYLYKDGTATGEENQEALSHLPKERAALAPDALWDRIMAAIADEAGIVVKEGVASEDGVDTAVRLAMNFPQGPFEWKKQIAGA
jgi:3-hydroxybutyryl-CoA dehydrogenase